MRYTREELLEEINENRNLDIQEYVPYNLHSKLVLSDEFGSGQYMQGYCLWKGKYHFKEAQEPEEFFIYTKYAREWRRCSDDTGAMVYFNAEYVESM